MFRSFPIAVGAIIAAIVAAVIFFAVREENSFNSWRSECRRHEGQHAIKTGQSTTYISGSKGQLTPITTEHWACTNATGVVQSTHDH